MMNKIKGKVNKKERLNDLELNLKDLNYINCLRRNLYTIKNKCYRRMRIKEIF